MIKGQKSVRGGIEDFLCPFTDMYITQGSGGQYSHKGTKAIDVRGAEAGVRYPGYAPCTVKCIKTYPSSGQVMWQSTGNVRCPNGYIGIVTFMVAHDNTMDAKIGMVVSAGSQLFNMGDKGNATGIHTHIEIAQTSDTSWRKNSYGIYCFNNEVEFEDACFMDNTNIISGTANWKYLKDVPVNEPKKEEPKPVVDENKVKIEKLENQIKELEKQIGLLNDDLIGKEQTIQQLENEVANLKEQLDDQPKLIFTCTQTNDYQIKLYDGEILYIK